MGDLTGTTIGHYHFGRLLGRGAMGEVYLAEHTHLKSFRAVKRLNPDLARDERYRNNFLAEGRHAAVLSHQGIASVFDTLEWNGELLLVMEYVEGHNLCEEETPMPLRGFLDLAIDCAEALAAAHHQGIVHRDLKPANIMLTRPENRAKILDFGVAKRLPSSVQDATTQYQYEEKERICGTLPYMSPEALLAEGVDHRADIFSLGVVFYEMVTGQHPFKGGTPTATADRILHTVPPPLQKFRADLPQELDRIISKMLAKEREDRYATSQDLAVDLRTLRRAVRGYGTGDDTQTETWDTGSGQVSDSSTTNTSIDYRKIVAPTLLVVLAALFLYWAWDWLGDQYYNTMHQLPERRVLAVMPFVLSGENEEDGAFIRGIQKTTETALRRLSPEFDFQVVGEDLVQGALGARQDEDPTEAISEIPIWTGANLVLTANVERDGPVFLTRLLLYHPENSRSDHLIRRRSSLELDPEDPLALGQTLLRETFGLMDLELPAPDARIFARLCPQVPAAAHAYFEATGLREKNSREELQRAASLLRSASAQDTRCGLALAALGAVYVSLNEKGAGTLGSARERCQESVKLNDVLVEGHQCLAEIDLIERNLEAAVSHLQTALFNDQTDDRVIEQLAGLYEMEFQDPERAARVYKEAMEYRPGYWWTRYRLGFLLADYPEVAGKLGLSVPELYDEAIQLAPYYFKAYLNAGIYYAYQEDWKEAEEYFEKSIRIYPSFLAYDNLGTACFFQRKYSSAVDYYKKAINMAVQDPDEGRNLTYLIYSNYAEALYHAPGEQENADRYFQEAIGLGEDHRKENPQDAEVWRRLAVCYSFLDEEEKALSYIEESLRLDPNRKETLLKKALILARARRFEEAFEWVKKALEAGVSPPEVRDDPTFVEMKQSDPERFDRLFTGAPGE